MREILFRGKRIDNGKWVEGWYQPEITIKHLDGRQETVGVTIDYKTEEGFLEDALVYPSTIGQFTGLNDKNGKRIFEGDICEIGNLIYKVEFKYSEWVFTILSKEVYCFPAFHSHCGEYCEIIGNIHDNPELLEVS